MVAARALQGVWCRPCRVRTGFDESRESGNMTAFLEITSGGRTQRVMWVPAVEGLEPPASPTEALYRYARRAAASVARDPR